MHRSWSREKRRADLDPTSYAEGKPVDAEGYIHSRNYIKASRIELDSNFSCAPRIEEANSIAFDFKGSSSKKKSKAQLRVPLAEGMSFEKQIRCSSPTVIARLMGLDTLPSPGSLKPHKEVKSCSQKISSKDFQEKLTRHDCLLKKCNDVHQEFKDVFEVVEVPKVENHKNQDFCKRRSNVKQSEMGTAFIRQSFINAKRLSTDEMLQRSKEFDNALEVLESNKNLFLKLLQEPHSLFSKHLQDLSHSPRSPLASHALIQKSSRSSPNASCESSLISEIKDNRSNNLKKSDSQPPKKPAANSNDHHFREPMYSLPAANSNGPHFREPMYSLPEALSESVYVEKVEDCAQPTQIVILKPSLAKARKAERTVPSVKSWDNCQYGVINHRELQKEEITEFYQEGGRPKLNSLENSRPRKKCTTELPKYATRETRNALETERKASVSKYSNYVHDDGLWPTPSVANGNDSLTSYCTSDNEYVKSFSPSSSSQWDLHEVGLSMRASSTLGEMLALSDNETLHRAQDTSIVKKASPLSISSNDGWKDGFTRNLPRSKSLSSSSLVYGNFNHNSSSRFVGCKSRFMPKNVQTMSIGTFEDEDLVKTKNCSLESLRDHQHKHHSNGKGNRLPVREIHVSSEECKHKSYMVPLAKEEQTACKLSHIHGAGVVDAFSVPYSNIAVPSLLMKGGVLKKLHKAIKSERECRFSDMLSKQVSAVPAIDELLPSYCTRPVSVSTDSYTEADQPSPVSVLELSSKGDKSTLSCMKKISTDLQDIQMQLQFLKFDSTDSFADEIEAYMSSDEDSGDPFPHIDGILQAFRDEEDRDYSYLLDMLIDSGILKSDKIALFSSNQSSDLPVSADIFNKLEKKYKSVESWPRSERKLLFDLINSTLADISAIFFMNICPLAKPSLSWPSKMAHGGLVEEIWQAVVRCRKDVSSRYSEENLIEPKWFNIGYDSELVGRELENLLSEHLMDQLLTELMYL